MAVATIAVEVLAKAVAVWAYEVGTDAVAKSAKDGTWKPGTVVLGLKEEGVGLAMDQYNAKLVTADMKKKLDAATADIVSGKIKVANYSDSNACKY